MKLSRFKGTEIDWLVDTIEAFSMVPPATLRTIGSVGPTTISRD